MRGSIRRGGYAQVEDIVESRLDAVDVERWLTGPLLAIEGQDAMGTEFLLWLDPATASALAATIMRRIEELAADEAEGGGK
jgi:hypothetical protein